MSVGAKLQLKANQTVAILHAPPGVAIDLPKGTRMIENPGGADAVVVFAANRAELDECADAVVDAARRDALAWLAYPKARQLDTDINRDIVSEALTTTGVQPVRQVSLDDIWSALRFRPT